MDHEMIWEDYPGLSMWVQYEDKDSDKRKTSSQRQAGSCDYWKQMREREWKEVAKIMVLNMEEDQNIRTQRYFCNGNWQGNTFCHGACRRNTIANNVNDINFYF